MSKSVIIYIQILQNCIMKNWSLMIENKSKDFANLISFKKLVRKKIQMSTINSLSMIYQ